MIKIKLRQKIINSILLLPIILIFGTAAFANNDASFSNSGRTAYLHGFIESQTKSNCGKQKNSCSLNLVAAFYSKHNFRLVWTRHGQLTSRALDFINILQHSYVDGLDPKAYRIDEINQLVAQLNSIHQTNNNTNLTESSNPNIITNQKCLNNSKSHRVPDVDSEGHKLPSYMQNDNSHTDEHPTDCHAVARNDGTTANQNESVTNNEESTTRNDDPQNNANYQRTQLVSAQLDVLLTDSFVRYADNLHNGLQDSKKLFPYWRVDKSQPNLIQLLGKSLNGNIESNLANLAPKYPGYAKLKQKLAAYRSVAAKNPWQPIPDGADLELGDNGSRVKMLQDRLFISGELKEIKHKGAFDDDLQKAVIRFQENMGLLDNGIVDKDTLDALNIPIEIRIQQIELNMDTMRSFPDKLGSEYIMVNIPDFSLNLVKKNKTQLSMDVAVGGVKHQSCILNSKITYLVANPAWHVPEGIAESELFPILQKSTDYLATHNIDVFKNNSSGIATMINPNKVNWAKMKIGDFRAYQFRQKPGVDNVLGKVKFIFQNSCQIYLHDSIESEVFDANERDLSHGCIRMGEPMKLTNYVLNQDNGWSKDKIAALFKTEKDKAVVLPKAINFYIVYLTSFVNDDDSVQFRNDIYNLNTISNYPLYIENSNIDESTSN